MRAIKQGDLAVVASAWGRNIIMVTTVHRRIFTGVLIHTFPEMATDADIAIRQGEVMTYPVILQFDLYGTFYRSQVAKVVGHVPVDRWPTSSLSMLNGIDVQYLATHLERMGIQCWRGLPVWRGDARWDHKIEQLQEELQPLTRPFWTAFEW